MKDDIIMKPNLSAYYLIVIVVGDFTTEELKKLGRELKAVCALGLKSSKEDKEKIAKDNKRKKKDDYPPFPLPDNDGGGGGGTSRGENEYPPPPPPDDGGNDNKRKKYPNTPWNEYGNSSGFIDPFYSIEEQIGGIELSASAEFPKDLGLITGAVFDPESHCLVLLGEKNLSVPSIKPEDLAIALLSVFGTQPFDPKFSLDPADPKNPKGKWLKAVYMPENILAGTEFGQAMFEADWLLKQYSFGVKVDESGKIHKRISSVSGFKSTADIVLDPSYQDYGVETWARSWIVSDEMKLKRYDNSIYFDVARMCVKSKKVIPDPSSPTGLRDVESQDNPIFTKFAEIFTNLYDEIAKESPEFERLRQLAKAVALAKWIKEQNIPIDTSWITKYADKQVVTVDKVNAISIQWRKEDKTPFSRDGITGVRTSIHKLHLFGGVDLTVKPKYVLGDQEAKRLQEDVKLGLNKGIPRFIVEHNGKNLQAVVLPITKNGQKIWGNPFLFESNGIKYQFNNERKITKITDKYGNITECQYNPNGSLVKVKISNSNDWKTVGEKNSRGSLWTVKTARGNTIKYVYNNLGYLSEVETDGHTIVTYNVDVNSQTLTAKYDEYSEKITYNRDGNIKEYERKYNTKDYLSSTPEDEKVIFDYDESGRLISANQSGITLFKIRYSESNSNPVNITLPQREISYLYEADGRVKKIICSTGISIAYFYKDHLLTEIEVDNNGSKASYKFSEDGIVSIKDLLGLSIDYTYSKGKISSVESVQYGKAKYTYDNQERLSEIRLPNGNRIKYQYDERKKSISRSYL